MVIQIPPICNPHPVGAGWGFFYFLNAFLRYSGIKKMCPININGNISMVQIIVAHISVLFLIGVSSQSNGEKAERIPRNIFAKYHIPNVTRIGGTTGSNAHEILSHATEKKLLSSVSVTKDFDCLVVAGYVLLGWYSVASS